MPRPRTYPQPLSNLSTCPALVAIECGESGNPGLLALDREAAGVLADALAHDLAAQVPQIGTLDFVVAGAVYDQAQLLRPHWPLHAALADALERLPGRSTQARVVALGTHAGRWPLPILEPEVALLGSPMLVMPWLLSGPADRVGEVADQFERELMERGLIGAELALALGEAFGIKTVHARHMTMLDLCALACAQYEHAGLGALWQIIETALLRPDQDQAVNLDDGSTLRWHDGTAWLETRDSRRLAQCRAVFGAHGIALAVPV